MKKISKLRMIVWIIAILALILLSSSFPSTVTYTAPKTAIAKEVEVKQVMVTAPKAKPVLVPQLVSVCSCESTGKWNGTPRQFDKNGKVIIGKVNPADIGMCQINTQPQNGHLAKSKKMGIDLWTEEGNITYANYLYSKNGLKDWGWSKHCWKDHQPL